MNRLASLCLSDTNIVSKMYWVIFCVLRIHFMYDIINRVVNFIKFNVKWRELMNWYNWYQNNPLPDSEFLVTLSSMYDVTALSTKHTLVNIRLKNYWTIPRYYWTIPRLCDKGLPFQDEIPYSAKQNLADWQPMYEITMADYYVSLFLANLKISRFRAPTQSVDINYIGVLAI